MNADDLEKALIERSGAYHDILANTASIKGKKFAGIVRCIARLVVAERVLCLALGKQEQAHSIMHAIFDQCIGDLADTFDDGEVEEAAAIVRTLVSIAKIA